MGRARRAHKDADREPRARGRATYARPHGARHLFAAYDLARDKLYGHVKLKKNRTKFLHFCRYLRTLYPRRGRLGGRPPAFDREASKQRTTVERRIDKLKQWRGLATRYDKTATMYLTGLHIAATFIWSAR
ncbi:transposase [Streptomyces albogriseolus]